MAIGICSHQKGRKSFFRVQLSGTDYALKFGFFDEDYVFRSVFRSYRRQLVAMIEIPKSTHDKSDSHHKLNRLVDLSV
ncbi:MAG: hypothetical protein U9Q05_12405 [Thermodesulfobacteriota bacterium]|nr:hypothetical protein [Thermodesulfobacteriota bacterium]